MWGSLTTLGANLKSTLDTFENSMDQAVGKPATTPHDGEDDGGWAEEELDLGEDPIEQELDNVQNSATKLDAESPRPPVADLTTDREDPPVNIQDASLPGAEPLSASAHTKEHQEETISTPSPPLDKPEEEDATEVIIPDGEKEPQKTINRADDDDGEPRNDDDNDDTEPHNDNEDEQPHHDHDDAEEEEEEEGPSPQLSSVSSQHCQEVQGRPASPALDEALASTLREREKQLESKAQQLVEAHGRIDELTEQVQKGRMLQEKLRTLQKEAHLLRAEREAREALEAKVQGLTEEGQKLAKKEGDLQRLVREKNVKLEEQEKEKAVLSKDRDALQEQVRQLEAKVHEHASQTSATSQSLAAMQAVSNASSSKLSSINAELRAAKESERDLREALEKSWASEKDLKRQIHELKAVNEDLLVRLGTGEEQTKHQEDTRRELEQREAMLQATQRQLQDTLARQQHEASLREESLRSELAEMKQRWKDAAQRAESCAADVQVSAAPLLSQIKALQEERRSKTQAWAAAESTLLERTALAEKAASVAEASRREAEKKVLDVLNASRAVEAELRETKSQLAIATAEAKSATARERTAQDRLIDLEAELQASQESHRRAMRDARTVEQRLKVELSESHEQVDDLKVTVESLTDQHRRRVQQLQTDIEELQDSQRRPLASPMPPSTPNRPSPQPTVASARSEFDTELESFVSQASQPGFVVQVEKLRMSLNQREAELSAAKEKLSQAEEIRDALTYEVQALGKRQAELEKAAGDSAKLRKQANALTKKNELLLQLLGEKTEEVEELQVKLGLLSEGT